MTQHNQDPYGLSMNGELASEADLVVMEQLAADLTLNIPSEEHRQYGYCTEAGSIAMFRTLRYEEEAELGSYASVLIAKGDYTNIQLELSYGYDNQMSSLFFKSDEELGEVAAAIQDLLDTGETLSVDSNILRHVQAVVFCIMGATRPENTAIMRSQNNSEEQEVADVIRHQVTANTACSLFTKVYGLPIDEEHTLTIENNVLVGEPSASDDISYLPSLQIEYEDRETLTTYCYTKYHNGDVELRTEDNVHDEADDQGENEDLKIEAEVELFLLELAIHAPSKERVDLIIRKLLDATFLEVGNTGA